MITRIRTGLVVFALMFPGFGHSDQSVIGSSSPLLCDQKGQLERQTIVLDGVERSSFVYTPPCLDRAKSYPLLVFYHGLYADAESQVTFTGWTHVADTYRFLIAFMDSAENTALPNRSAKGWDYHSDSDIRFTNQMLTLIRGHFPIDSKRMYACGHSMGGRMTMIIMSQTNHFAAACAFAPGPQFSIYQYAPSTPKPFYVIQGNQDHIIALFLSDRKLTAVRDEILATHRAIRPEPHELRSRGAPWDRIEFKSTRFPSGNVMWLYIDGMGHIEWPSPYSARSFATPRDVNEMVWEFLSQYRLP